VFLIDTASLRVSINSIADNTPAAVELMPGVAPGPITEIKEHIGVPVIAAGLIRTRDEALAALGAGADAVSMSEQSLWNERFR
jgi:glycerol uptake operon antiterminator